MNLKAYDLGSAVCTGTELMNIEGRLECLKTIVHGNKHALKEAKRHMVSEFKGPAIRCSHDLSITRLPRTCTFCWFPGDNKGSKCKAVYYGSRDCQVFDYKEQHKHVCVEPCVRRQVQRNFQSQIFLGKNSCVTSTGKCFVTQSL